jgi:hypothetical protein
MALPKSQKTRNPKWPMWPEWRGTQGIVDRVGDALVKDARHRGDQREFLDFCLEHLRRKRQRDTRALDAWTALKYWLEFQGHRKGVPLPLWVLQYLHEAATAIQALRADSSGTAKQKAAMVPAALGFVSAGWNAFNRDDRQMMEIAAALTYRRSRKSKEPASVAMERVMQLAAVSDERSARRLIGRGKTAMKDLP